MTLNPRLTDYVERNIIPQYAGFDKAHREDHAHMVMEQSLKLAERMPELNIDMVYVVAAFHDLGLVNGRENHHLDSQKILLADEFLKQHFTEEQRQTMGEAVADHRASNRERPRNPYGLIVAEADRFIDPETIIRRTVQYGFSHYPELDKEGHYRRTLDHLENKYGPNGYLKIWIPWSENATRLQELHRIIADETQIRTLFGRIFGEETGG
ncbi:MAG: HD domain-containing protein [Bacteroides sp.]|nr:HD domain-containing protein [Bacteroides sp.]MCM1085073.1 HD domain-containing protein [Bacteroides sp.]